MDYGAYRIEISGMPHFFTGFGCILILAIVYKMF